MGAHKAVRGWCDRALKVTVGGRPRVPVDAGERSGRPAGCVFAVHPGSRIGGAPRTNMAGGTQAGRAAPAIGLGAALPRQQAAP